MANVDRILEILRQKKSTSISSLSKSLNLKKEDIQKSAEYLEQDGIIKIEHKWPQVVLTLSKDNNQELAGQQPLPPPPLNEPQPVQRQQQKSMPIPPQNQITSKTPSFQPVSKIQEPQINKSQSQNSLNNSKPITSIQPPHQIQQQKPMPVPPLNEDLLQSPTSQPSLNPLTQEQQSQVSQPSPNVNPIFSTPVSKHQNLPPPPIPKNKSFQSSTINYAEQPMHEILKSKQEEVVEPNFNSFNTQEDNQEDDPLNPNKPHFNLDVPSPGDEETKFLSEQIPIFSNSTEFSSTTIDVPSNLGNDMEKIEFLLNKLLQQINNHEYNEINDVYRKVHSIYMESENISPNERYLISQKINDMFERIKHLYTIEEI